MPDVVVSFALRGERGRVVVHVEPNTDPVATGSEVIGVSTAAALGYPVCEAVIEYPRTGYLAAMGWVQLVRSSDGRVPGEYELDPLAVFRDVDSPYAFFGIRPQLFDAPSRAARMPMTWQARSFLCASPDGVMSRTVLPLCAFSWGFAISEMHGQPMITAPDALHRSYWKEHLHVLEAAHPAWRFRNQPGDAL